MSASAKHWIFSKFSNEKYWRLLLIILVVVGSSGFVWLGPSDYSDATTAIQVFLGCISFWFTLKIFELGNHFNARLEQTVNKIERASLVTLKSQYLNNLKNLSLNAVTPSTTRYWQFVWKFETYNSLYLGLEEGGDLIVSVLGRSEDPFSFNVDGNLTETYTAKVLHPLSNKVFSDGQTVFCKYGSDHHRIASHGTLIQLQEPRVFTIKGHGQSREYDGTESIPCWTRIKDLSELPEI